MKNLSASLINFHSNLKPIKKDAQNPFFKSDYLTLSGILDSVRPQLSAQKLAIVQFMRVVDQFTILVTKLIHESGESIESEMILPHNPDPQKYGSLITYYKRYQLQALLGISTAEDDDDANSVSESKPMQAPRPASKAPSEAQLKAIWAISKKLNIETYKPNTFEEASAWINKHGGKN